MSKRRSASSRTIMICVEEIHGMQTKPRLTFFRYKVSRQTPEFLLIHRREQLECLEQFFQLTVIDENCDYQYICDKYQPDLTLFESGLNMSRCERLKIVNSDVNAAIPKLGFINADAWCETRAGTLSEMEEWGIETFFSISTTAPEHMPDLAAGMFLWPPFIDTGTYHDYGEQKIIPVMLTGSRAPQYPWRRAISKLIVDYYPTLSCPHGGYVTRSRTGQVICGEQYARTLNASLIAPSCGTVAREVVRKHFEIPGCRACLITESSPGLKAAGFVDMKNCVFADDSNILDKLDYLFNNPDELEAITQAGYELVHSRHSSKHRGQILQWYSLNKTLRGSQNIVQPDPFAPLAVAETPSAGIGSPIGRSGLHLQLLREGDDKLWAGKFDAAEELYNKCLNYMQRLPEAKFRLALCCLYQGHARRGHHWSLEPIKYTLREYKALDPDPVEWAYYIISLLCLGRLKAARKCADQFRWVQHPELNRVRCVVKILANSSEMMPPLVSDRTRPSRTSIHQLPERSPQRWIEELCKMLSACDQNHLVDVLAAPIVNTALEMQEKADNVPSAKALLSVVRGTHQRPSATISLYQPKQSVTAPALDYRRFVEKVYQKLNNGVIGVLQRVERIGGYFLPYALSEMRKDELCRVIERFAREETIRTALIVGAASGRRSTEVLLRDYSATTNGPVVFCLVGVQEEFTTLRNRFRSHGKVNLYHLPSPSPVQASEELERAVKKIKEDNDLNLFDMVVLEDSETAMQVSTSENLIEELDAAQFVVLNEPSRTANAVTYQRLLRSPVYKSMEYNLMSPKGYAIFRKLNIPTQDQGFSGLNSVKAEYHEESLR